MDRTDSAFDETFRLKAFEQEPKRIHRSNTAPTRSRKSKRTSPDLSSNSHSTSVETHRPASEKPATTTHGKRTGSRRKSITYSSDDSIKSRRRGHGSIPSSRRTSCTIVDPSRPARHYRIKSSQTCPTVSRDVDDVIALHFRSCSLFQTPTCQSTLPSPVIPGYQGTDVDSGPVQPRPETALQTSDNNVAYDQTSVAASTTMHWMSPSTRRDQYDKIDKANSGLRGLLRKVLPRCVSGPPSTTFYENDKSDVGSVRRYRMDMSDEDECDEKSALRLQHRKLQRSATHKTDVKVKRWGCF